MRSMNVLSVAGDDGMDGMEWEGLRAGNGIPTFFFFPSFLILFFCSILVCFYYCFIYSVHSIPQPPLGRGDNQ